MLLLLVAKQLGHRQHVLAEQLAVDRRLVGEDGDLLEPDGGFEDAGIALRLGERVAHAQQHRDARGRQRDAADGEAATQEVPAIALEGRDDRRVDVAVADGDPVHA